MQAVVDAFLTRELPAWYQRDPSAAIRELKTGDRALEAAWRGAAVRAGGAVQTGRLGPIPGLPEHHAWQTLEHMFTSEQGAWQLTFVRLPAVRQAGETAFVVLCFRPGRTRMLSWRKKAGGAELVEHELALGGAKGARVLSTEGDFSLEAFAAAVAEEVPLSAEEEKKLCNVARSRRTSSREFSFPGTAFEPASAAPPVQTAAPPPDGRPASRPDPDAADPASHRGFFISFVLLFFVGLLAFMPVLMTYLAIRDGGAWGVFSLLLWFLLGAGVLASLHGFTYRPKSGTLTTWQFLPVFTQNHRILPGDTVQVEIIRLKYGMQGFRMQDEAGRQILYTPIDAHMARILEALHANGVNLIR